jgi:uncharacterized protein
MRSLSKLAPLALTLAAFVPSLAQDKGTGKRLFWHVTTDKTETWLLGSVHVGSEDFYPLPKEIVEAYKKSAALVVEADITAGDPAQVQQLVLEKGMYGEEDDSISKHISKDAYKALKARLKKLGFPLDTAKKMKPWLLAMQLEQMETQGMGMRADLGIDLHFLQKAHKSQKTIVELESVEQQLDLLSGLSDDLQEKFLASSDEDQAKAKESLEGILDAWKKGDGAKMDELEKRSLKDHPEAKPVMDKLIDERNVEMTKKIEGFLAGDKGPHFVVVGSMHLVGEKGIVSLLEKTGKYKIEQVAVTEPEKKDSK